jgi:hypothetical protein
MPEEGEPMDLRSPEERAHNAREAEKAILCEASRLLSAFEILGFEKFVTPQEIGQQLGVQDTDFVQARLDDLVRLKQVISELGRYKANLLTWRSTLRTGDLSGPKGK